jgi:hypothetical protein
MLKETLRPPLFFGLAVKGIKGASNKPASSPGTGSNIENDLTAESCLTRVVGRYTFSLVQVKPQSLVHEVPNDEE